MTCPETVAVRVRRAKLAPAPAVEGLVMLETVKLTAVEAGTADEPLVMVSSCPATDAVAGVKPASATTWLPVVAV